MPSGFFTREERKGKRNQPDFPVEYLHRMGLAGVAGMNPDAQSPNMKPDGSNHPVVYFLGEAPGAEEDRQGRPFVGPSGRLLRYAIPERFESRVRISNVVRTRPPKNRQPKPLEIECFRPSLVEDIERTKPRAIIGTGAVPLQWALPRIGSIKVCRGRRFPIKVGSLPVWFYPVLHPAYILRMLNTDKREEVSGEEWRSIFEADIRRAFEHLDDPPPDVESADEANLLAGIDTVWTQRRSDLDRIVAHLEALEGQRVAIDFETNRKRPYAAGARILCVGVGTSENVLSFLFEHPRFPWHRRRLGQLRAAFLRFLRRAELVAHNAAFETEWATAAFGERYARMRWHCSMLQAFTLDERKGGHSLDFLCRLHFGLPLKRQSAVSGQMRLEAAVLPVLLRYNALDVKYTHRLFERQAPLVRRERLGRVYRSYVRLIPTLSLAQARGLPVDQRAVSEFKTQYAERIETILGKIRARPEVARFERKFGPFKVASQPHLTKMFRDILQRQEGVRGEKYSTDKEALAAMAKVPLAALLIDLRTVSKLKSTYVDRLDANARKTHVYPDGLLHPGYKNDGTRTGRLSSEDPNIQNFPKRHDAEVRRQIVAPPGMTLVSSDYGQIEARVIGMASRDRRFVRALWENYDVHQEWAERIARVHPRALKKHGDLKTLRSMVKNQFVFPAFYGSHYTSIARAMELPEALAEELFEHFWQTFAGVRQWQQDLLRFYRKHGYVECLTGRRRRAPLSSNAILNSPIQGTASDIVTDAMNRLSERAQREDKPYLQPVINVHDDLEFFVPDQQLETAVAEIVSEMLAVPFPFVNVPISIEVAYGKNWFELQELAKFASND